MMRDTGQKNKVRDAQIDREIYVLYMYTSYIERERQCLDTKIKNDSYMLTR